MRSARRRDGQSVRRHSPASSERPPPGARRDARALHTLVPGLPLSELERQRLLSELLEAQASSPTRPLVILTTQEVRRRLQRLVDQELPRVAVIAYQELSPDVDIRPYGRIGERWPEGSISGDRDLS